jgi:Cu/Ag efflux pump CusA
VHPLVLTFGLAVLASMLVASAFTPALAWLLLGPRAPRLGGAAGLARRLLGLYQAVLRRMLALPAMALAWICLVGLAGLIAIPFLKQPAPPTFLDRNVVVNWAGPPGASIQELDRITRRTVGELRALPAVASSAAVIGRAVTGDQIVNTNSGQIFVSIRPSADYSQAVNSIRAIVQGTPGMYASVSTYEGDVMHGVLASSQHDLVVRIYGQNYDTLRGLARQVQGVMSKVHALGAPQVLLPPVQPTIEISINDQIAFKAGVAAGDARRESSTLVEGLTVGNFFVKQAVFDVVVRGVAAARSSVADVRNLLLDTSNGRHVRLSHIAAVGVHSDPVDVQHEAVSRYLDVSAPVRRGSLSAAQQALRLGLGHVSYPLAYHAEILAGNPFDGTSHMIFLSYALAALLGMLLLAQAAFASWRLAVVFIVSLPVALAGGLLVALATGQIGSLGADAGLLAVLAIAVRHGMLQIGQFRRIQSRHGGAITAEIVAQGATERLAPSLGALVVAAVGMLPFVIEGNVAGNEITHVTAAVIMGGLISTALLTGVLLPALCLTLLGGGQPPPDQSLEELELSSALIDSQAAEPVVHGGS